MKIILDAMGGDNAPGEIIKGAVDAVNKSEKVTVILVGLSDVITEELKKYEYDKKRIQIRHASEVISTEEVPTVAIKRKKDSSIVVGAKMIKAGEADAFVSAGSTGAVMVAGVLVTGRIRGIERPTLGALIPTKKGVALLVDSGANADCRPEQLLQFAQMGSIYMEYVMGVKSPKVCLVNIGLEEEKGNALVKETHPLLKACDKINYQGFIESREIAAGQADVIVADGFTGNVALKMYEGVANVLLDEIKGVMMSNIVTKIGALLIKKSLKKTLKKYDAKQYGGAPLLGLNGLIVKTHGSSKAGEVCNSILQCETFKEQGIGDKIKDQLGRKPKVKSEIKTEESEG